MDWIITDVTLPITHHIYRSAWVWAFKRNNKITRKKNNNEASSHLQTVCWTTKKTARSTKCGSLASFFFLLSLPSSPRSFKLELLGRVSTCWSSSVGFFFLLLLLVVVRNTKILSNVIPQHNNVFVDWALSQNSTTSPRQSRLSLLLLLEHIILLLKC